MIKKLISSFLCLLLLITFSACAQKGYPVTFGETEINSSPERVVILSSSVASAFSAMGYGEFIVGAPKEFIDAEQSSAVDIGSEYELYEKTIVALKPDLIVTSFELSSSFKNTLEEENIPLINLIAPTTYEELDNYYSDIAKIFVGMEKYSEVKDEFVATVNTAFEKLNSQNRNISKKVVVYIESGFVATGDTFSGQVLEKAGITNIASDKTNYMMSAVDIVAANPDVIFCPKGTGDSIMTNDVFKEVNAVKNASVYEVDVSSLIYAGKNMTSVLEEMTNYLSK